MLKLPPEGSDGAIQCHLLLADGKTAKGAAQMVNTAGVQPKVGLEAECVVLNRDFATGELFRDF